MSEEHSTTGKHCSRRKCKSSSACASGRKLLAPNTDLSPNQVQCRSATPFSRRGKMWMAAKTKIVFFNVCSGASRFTSRTKAEGAAEIYSRTVRYACEAFYCEKQH